MCVCMYAVGVYFFIYCLISEKNRRTYAQSIHTHEREAQFARAVSF